MISLEKALHLANLSNLLTAIKTYVDGQLSTLSSSLQEIFTEIDTELDKRAIATDYTATMSTAWVGSAAPYTLNIPIDGIKANDKPIIDIEISTTAYETQETEWTKIIKAESYDGGVKFYAREKTTISLPIKVKVVK